MRILFISIFIFFTNQLTAQKVETVKVFTVEKAHQAVAVDESHFYVINNSEIVKYDKLTGRKISLWKDDSGEIKHLNSGVVIDGKLYCANSNFPEIPIASSIEIFDTRTMQHAGNYSFGIDIGSATWIDSYEGNWYVVFAHYPGKNSEPGKDNRWTQLVKFSPDGIRQESWIFPKELIEKFGNYSNSGGFFSSEGVIYATGHDDKELYLLSLPEKGYTLKWLGTIPAPFEGQGIAADPADSGVIYGISRKNSQVIAGRLKK